MVRINVLTISGPHFSNRKKENHRLGTLWKNIVSNAICSFNHETPSALKTNSQRHCCGSKANLTSKLFLVLCKNAQMLYTQLYAYSDRFLLAKTPSLFRIQFISYRAKLSNGCEELRHVMRRLRFKIENYVNEKDTIDEPNYFTERS